MWTSKVSKMFLLWIKLSSLCIFFICFSCFISLLHFLFQAIYIPYTMLYLLVFYILMFLTSRFNLFLNVNIYFLSLCLKPLFLLIFLFYLLMSILNFFFSNVSFVLCSFTCNFLSPFNVFLFSFKMHKVVFLFPVAPPHLSSHYWRRYCHCSRWDWLIITKTISGILE